MDPLAPQQNKHSLWNPIHPLIVSEVDLSAYRHIACEEPPTEENLLNLRKRSENLWRLGHKPLPSQLPTHSSVWWKLHSMLITPKQWGSTFSSQSVVIIAPWRGKVSVFLIPPLSSFMLQKLNSKCSWEIRSPFIYAAPTCRWMLEAGNSR